jgi:hypothetical protein
MITANTRARIVAVERLHTVRNGLMELRSFINFNDSEVQEIDSMVDTMDKLINRIMK